MSNFPSLLFSLCKFMFFPSCSHYIGQCLLNCPVFHWPNLYEHVLVCLVCCFLKIQVRWAGMRRSFIPCEEIFYALQQAQYGIFAPEYLQCGGILRLPFFPWTWLVAQVSFLWFWKFNCSNGIGALCLAKGWNGPVLTKPLLQFDADVQAAFSESVL